MQRSELVTVALLGTDRRSPTTDPGSGDPATTLLDQAIRSSTAVRAGRVLPRLPERSLGPVEHPVWAPAAAQTIMGRLLDRPQAELVNLWLVAAAEQRLGLVPEHWAPLAAYATRNTGVDRRLLASALGAAGLWFLGQNPAWSRLAVTPPPQPDRPADPVVPAVQPAEVERDPELVFAAADPWPRPLVEVALMVVGTGRLGWRTSAYASALAARLPFEHLALLASATAFYAPSDGPPAPRIVRDAFATLDRTLDLRVAIRQAFGLEPAAGEPEESL